MSAENLRVINELLDKLEKELIEQNIRPEVAQVCACEMLNIFLTSPAVKPELHTQRT